MNEEKTHIIGDQEIKDSDLTPEQNMAKAHILSLREKINRLEFELNDLLPSLRYYESELLKSVKDKAEEVLGDEIKTVGES
tara:strand:+ start:1240 stop:1482 length:243 start_codon:yes stop_codon:yes gene_type:complete